MKSQKKSLDKEEKVKIYKHKPRKYVSENVEIEKLKKLYETVNADEINNFDDVPLSSNTRKGLKDGKFKIPTEIQKMSILLALKGSDILGAAKTGSGKTLAFLVPVLENLFTKKWSSVDGLGALIITPTRELAYQIFEVLKIVGSHHDFSAGLIIGGKDLKFERKRMDKCNIIICTPGRLLQHMDENPLFDCTNLQMLVLDEADRILDLGFQTTMTSIVDYLPVERQTILFSATQTKSVKDLARLSLHKPMYVSVHEHSEFSTPEGLEQSYIVSELHDKINLLWSFIKRHKRSKILVFMSSCKQVKYTYEAFCRMQPGMSILSLYGTLHQMRRMSVYDQFVRKKHAVLFATDIAARGLDFPSVNWVVQLDCPEDAKTYIHRAGRTARFEKGGEALLVLLPSEEEGMLKELQEKKIPINRIRVNPNKCMAIQKSLEVKCARDVNLKESAQRAFVSYLKSVFLMKNKKIFDIKKIDTNAYSASLGLTVPPRVRFLQKYLKQLKEKKKIEEPSADDGESTGPAQSSSKENFTTLDFSGEEDSDEDLFTVKNIHFAETENTEETNDVEESKNIKRVTKASIAKKILKKNIKANMKIKYTDEGEVIEDIPKHQKNVEEEDEEIGGIDISKSKAIMMEEDKIDKQIHREKIKLKHREKRLKEKKQRKKHIEEDVDQMGEEESDDESINLDFLPDPDKIYGQNSDSENVSEQESEEIESDVEESVPEIKKRKAKPSDGSKKSNTKKRKLIQGTEEVMDTGLNIEDDEELALHLLNAS